MIPLVSKQDVDASRPLKLFTDPKTAVVRTIPFSAGPPRWLEYTQDVFDDVLWRWQYNRDVEDSPRNLVPHCGECLTAMMIAGQPKFVRVPYDERARSRCIPGR